MRRRQRYDLYQLAGQADVRAMLTSDEYAAIKSDYDQISRAFFAKSYFQPEGMTFAKSMRCFRRQNSRMPLAVNMTHNAASCAGAFPSWAEVLARFESLRDRL